MKKLFIFVSLIAATASFAAQMTPDEALKFLAKQQKEENRTIIGPMIDITTGLPIASGFGSKKMDITGVERTYQLELAGQQFGGTTGKVHNSNNNQTIPAYGLSPLRTITSVKQFKEVNKEFDAWKLKWEKEQGFKPTTIPSEYIPFENPRIYSGGFPTVPDHIIAAQKMKENEDKEIRQIIDRSGGGKLRPPRDSDNRMLVRGSTIEQLRLKANRRLISYISRHEIALVNVNYKLYHFKSIYIKMLTDSTTDENRKKVEVLIKRIESARDIITKQMETYRKQLKYNELLKQKEKNESPK